MRIDTDVIVWDMVKHRKLRLVVSLQAFDGEKEIQNINTLYSCLRKMAEEMVGMPSQSPDRVCQTCRCEPCGCGNSVTSAKLGFPGTIM